ncbi:NADPH-dependent FMN reductase [Halobacteriovorax sp. HLS]|uniref:NADPH-dependent FMN reductase n=1 Tax=Halobacteriovorax sp. HLS TaxID=2234000 RepID=UPI0013E39D16|nr:NAD(P)H-dependent oxidoreductase [Halobacteriovorax sp. HLS]
MKKEILIVAASDGNNLKLANTLLDVSKDYDANFEVLKLSDFNLPIYTSSEEKNGTPKDAIALTDKFMKADGFIVIAPEYNGSVPPILINSISWISRSGNDNWRDAFNSKPVVLATHSGGGGQHVLMAMQEQFSFIGCTIIGRKLHTHYQKQLNFDSAKATIEQLVRLAKA